MALLQILKTQATRARVFYFLELIAFGWAAQKGVNWVIKIPAKPEGLVIHSATLHLAVPLQHQPRRMLYVSSEAPQHEY
jgi:hypothetical protein